MNEQERQTLQPFLQDLVNARVDYKDPEAQAMINEAIARQPDGAYLLVQRTLLQQHALEAAQQQIAELRSRLQNTQATQASGGGFLDAASSWGRSAGSRPLAPPPQPAPAAAETPPVAYGSAPARGPFAGGGMGGMLGGGSFLGSMAATAAGVAAGSFLFHGIDQFLHHHDQGAARQGFGGFDQPGADRLADDAGRNAGSLSNDAGLDDIGSADNGSIDDGGGMDDLGDLGDMDDGGIDDV